MNNRITRNRQVIGLAMVALIVGCFQFGTGRRQPAKAQVDDGIVFVPVFGAPLGIIPGQKLRISLGTRQGSREEAPVLWFFAITLPNGQMLFESVRVEVPSNEWRFSEVSREALNIEGEPGTGRVQAMVQIFIQAPRGSKPDITGSLEVVNESTGETAYGIVLK